MAQYFGKSDIKEFSKAELEKATAMLNRKPDIEQETVEAEVVA